MENNQSLQLLNKARIAIQECNSIKEAKEIRGQAKAVLAYMRTKKERSTEVKRLAEEVDVRTGIRIGQLCKSLEQHPTRGGRPKTTENDSAVSKKDRLKEAGLTEKDASRYESLADVAERKPELVEEIIAKAKETDDERVTAAGLLYRAARDERKEKEKPPPKVETPGFPDGPFRTIVVDPPWPIEKIAFDRRPVEKIELDYRTWTLEEIAHLPMSRLADERGAHIYLWVTHKHLPSGLELFKNWGVRYECVLTWNKPTAQPLWWRFLTEHILFGKINSLAPLKKGEAVSFSAPQQKHSHKPDEFFELVRRVSPEPRLTMFDGARESFTCWGHVH